MKRPYRSTRSRAPFLVVRVNGHSESWLRKGFPWVYPAEVLDKGSQVGVGRTVRLEGAGGRSLGVGIWDDGWIAVRRFRVEQGPLDAALISGLVEAALARRRGVMEGSTAWRAIHGENDGLPGIWVDCWGRWLTIRLDSASLVPLLEPLVGVLRRVLEPVGIFQGWRPDPREKRPMAGDGSCALLWGQAPAGDVPITEGGRTFLVRPAGGADAGFYPDMRENRTWLESFWEGARALNLFSYTGAFSVFAATGGARRVVSVDTSTTAQQRARSNFEANGLCADDWEFPVEDVFRVLDYHRRKGEVFDIVIIDGPAFSRSGAGTWSSEKDMARIVAAACRVLEREGVLVVASNQGSFTPRAFQDSIRQGSRRAGRPLRLVHSGSQPPDFPAALDFPEGRYLKFWVLRG